MILQQLMNFIMKNLLKTAKQICELLKVFVN